MKNGTDSLLKYKKLKRRLSLCEWQVNGVLETIWKATRDNAPEGDIGRFTNEDIAALIEWEGDPDILVEALVDTGWLDPDEEYRLIVHDWSDHVPNYLKGAYAKNGKLFADQSAKQRCIPTTSCQAPAKHQKKGLENVPPNLTKPNQVYPNQHLTKPVGRLVGGGDVDMGEVVVLANKLSRALPSISRDDCWTNCYIGVAANQADFASVVADIRDRSDIKKPTSFLKAALRRIVDDSPYAWSYLEAEVPPCPPSKNGVSND